MLPENNAYAIVAMRTIQDNPKCVARVIIHNDGWVQIEKMTRKSVIEEWKSKAIRLSPMDVQRMIGLFADPSKFMPEYDASQPELDPPSCAGCGGEMCKNEEGGAWTCLNCGKGSGE
jgi:hypothetical protein